jgi:hypothetical protein
VLSLRTITITALIAWALSGVFYAQGQDQSLPRLVHENGRHALMVDGAPYLVLGAQINNSSA